MTHFPCQANAFTIEQIRMNNNNNYLPGSITNDSHHNMMGINILNEPGINPTHNTQSYSMAGDSLRLCNPGQICSTGNPTWVGRGGLCEHQGSVALDKSRELLADTAYIQAVYTTTTTTSAVPNFTFTTPTQSSLQSPALVSYTQPRYLGSRTITHSFAPVGFTQWQHSVPQRLPWSSAGMVSQAAVSVFTGSTTQSAALQFSHPATSWTSIMSGPVASCSEEPKRPKRHASEDLQFLGSSSKVHLTEERFAKHMEDLSIHCMATDKNTTNSGLQTRVPPDRGGNDIFQSEQHRPNVTGQSSLWKQWENFQHLEESLDVSDEEADNRSCDTKRRKTPPTIHMVKDLDKLLANPDIIPKNILAEIRRPRMELVLYSPPSKVDPQGSVQEESANSDDQTTTTTRYEEEEDYCMETDYEDSLQL